MSSSRVKYRFMNDERSGFSAAIFPRVILPTVEPLAGEKTRLLLPVWVEKDFAGGTSLFGGGGYEINPGPGNRDFWQAGVAADSRPQRDALVGAEVTQQGPRRVGGTAQTRAGARRDRQAFETLCLLLSGGPTWADHQTGYHLYAALGLDF